MVLYAFSEFIRLAREALLPQLFKFAADGLFGECAAMGGNQFAAHWPVKHLINRGEGATSIFGCRQGSIWHEMLAS